MSERLGTALLLTVFGLFIAAVLLILHVGTPIRLVGLILVLAGLVAAVFAPTLATAQKGLAEKPYIPQHWEGVRPLTLRLWGVGVAVLGVLMLFGALG